MYGYIYLTTNLINSRKYIGQHKSECFDTNYYGSGKVLLQAITAYGKDNFKCEILCECFSAEELNAKEEFYIEKYNAVNSNEFYNLKPGGLGKSVSGVIYITNGKSCKKVLPEELEYYKSIGYHRGGPIPTEEAIRKRVQSNTGKKHPTAGPNISKALTGKKLSFEHRKSISDAKKGKPAPHKWTKVRCIETGKVYDNLRLAANDVGAKSTGNICSCLKGNRPHAMGYHWEYVD